MLKLYSLEFLSKSTRIRAYTLFGAISWAYKLLGKDVKALLDKFNSNPPFIISSPFPIVESKCGYVLAFPKPVLEMKLLPKEEREDICKKLDIKRIKKAEYVSFGVLKDILEGKIIYENELFDADKYSVMRKKKVITHKTDFAIFEDVPDLSIRNQLNRIAMKSENLFTEEAFYFSDRFFLIKYYDQGVIEEIEECFKLIEDTGLGANKNLGWGKVKIKDSSDEFKEELKYIDSKISTKGAFLTLSPVIPKKDSLDFGKSFYKTEIYKAPVDTSFGNQFLWKDKVMYLIEGSKLKPKNRYVGHLKMVASLENFKVYQYGFEFPLLMGGDDHASGQ